MASVDGSKMLLASSDEGFKFECSPCEYEGNRKEAKFFCFDCNEYLCETCKQHHQKLAATRKHQVVSEGSLPGKRAPHKQAQSENASLCFCNYGKLVTVYCKGHNKVICADCKRLRHRGCESLSIEVACVEIDQLRKEQTLQKAKELKEEVAILKQKRSEDMGDLTSQTDECRGKVKSFRKEIDELLDKLEKKAISDIEAFENDKRSTIQQHLDICDTALANLEIDYRSLESTMTAEKQLLFIQNLTLAKTIDYVKEALYDMDNEPAQLNISFECDQTLKYTNATSLGTVKTTEIKVTPRVIVNLNVKSSTKVDTKHTSDNFEPCISGSVFMPNRELVLCDLGNCVVKVLDRDFKLKEQIKMQSAPWDISAMSHDEVLVSLPDEKSLSFLKVFPKLQLVSSIQLNQVCRGVAVCDGSIYVSFDDRKVQILDKSGQQLTNIYDAFQFKFPYYILVPKTGMLIVSEHRGNAVRFLGNGKEQYSYKHPELIYHTGMYVDGDLNVYVCGYQSNNVHVIDKNGKNVKILLSATDGLYCPYTISFRESDNTLVVGGSSKLLVFKLG